MSQMLQPSQGTTSTGLAPNVAAALAYVFSFISGIIFLVVEKENQFVRFHAAQSIVFAAALVALNIALSIAAAVVGILPGVGGILAGLIGLAGTLVLGLGGFAAWVFLIIQAATGKEFEVPVAAPYARRIAGSQIG